jgi:glycosyltransferase involved in cell wall biosynthesis
MQSGESAQKMLTAIVTVGSRPLNEIRISAWATKLRNLDLEIIFVFDNFDNEILKNEISELYSSLDINHKIINVKIQSPGKSREVGLKVANGNWIVFWDCDDDPLNTNIAIERCKESAPNLNFLFFKYRVRDLLKKKSNNESDLRVAEFPVHWAKNPGIWRIFFRKSRIANLEFEDMRMGEDQVFLVKCNMNEEETAFFDEVAYQYFVGNSGQLTNSISSKEEIRQAVLSVEDFLSSKQGKTYRYQRQIRFNLTKTATRIELFRRKGMYQRLKYIVFSKQVRHLATLYFIEKVRKGE